MASNTETVSPRMIHTTDEMWEAIRAAADSDGITMAEAVRRAITEWLERRP